ncbi:alcohol dehydrogenase [Scardovia wiggsiae]|uniref:alcohol dehydrogenase n=1 Tax=Scardovia wiggsiae TaxID=230143 RepID=UPI00374F56D5
MERLTGPVMPEPEGKPSEQGRYAVLPDGTVTAAGHDLPMTYQWPVWLRLLAACVTGAAVACIGTVSHRMGAANSIPYGAVLSLLIVTASAWSARARSGYAGLILHFIFACGTAWGLAILQKTSSALVAVASPAFVTYASQHVWQWWLYGIIIVQVILAFFPARWFTVGVSRAVRRGMQGSEPSRGVR